MSAASWVGVVILWKTFPPPSHCLPLRPAFAPAVVFNQDVFNWLDGSCHCPCLTVPFSHKALSTVVGAWTLNPTNLGLAVALLLNLLVPLGKVLQ